MVVVVVVVMIHFIVVFFAIKKFVLCVFTEIGSKMPTIT